MERANASVLSRSAASRGGSACGDRVREVLANGVLQLRVGASGKPNGLIASRERSGRGVHGLGWKLESRAVAREAWQRTGIIVDAGPLSDTELRR